MKTCKLCGDKHHAKGYCQRHYQQGNRMKLTRVEDNINTLCLAHCAICGIRILRYGYIIKTDGKQKEYYHVACYNKDILNKQREKVLSKSYQKISITQL